MRFLETHTAVDGPTAVGISEINPSKSLPHFHIWSYLEKESFSLHSERLQVFLAGR